MPTVIDPVSGLPILTSYLPDEIDQIPFNVQVFPWDDYHAADRPARGAAYPDDILPTSANVAGQDSRNPIYIQTVYTDGNHRLLVATTPDPAGSGTPQPQKYLSIDGVCPDLTTNTPFGGMSATQEPVYGWLVSVAIDPATLPASGFDDIQVIGNDGTSHHFFTFADGIVSKLKPGYDYPVFLPTPMLFSSIFAADHIDFIASSGSGTTQGQASLWVYIKGS